ncbi:4'-phosphopantetheinyl transferase superfamily protein [Streptomyces sp. NPDC003077]|uniref:4'-phosphopantetheinyl transferase family protein n=1 Tax=Streptomyces sp. NPDC003077 TaxID=3154443 RepID=UPI0033B38EAC
MIGELLPPSVAWVERFDDETAVSPYAEEEAVIEGAGAERRRSFRTARHCARRAMAELGLPPAPVLPGRQGEPRWPDGVVGSITHCAGYRCAALAPATALRGLGIDAEPHRPVPPRFLRSISLPQERAALARLADGDPSIHWGRLLFSAKEAVYKVWFPLMRCRLGFGEADIRFSPDGRFTARLLLPGPVVGERPVGTLHGRWSVRDGLALTAIGLEA